MLTALLVAWMSGVILALGILGMNRLPLLAWDSPKLLLGCLIGVGIPMAVAVLILTTILARTHRLRWARRLGGVASVPAWLAAGTLAALILISLIGGPGHKSLLLRHIPVLLFLVVLAWLNRKGNTRAVPRLALGAVATLLTIVVGLATGVPFRPPTPIEPPTAGPAVHDGPIVLLGIDGLCWETLQRWERAGGSPDYETLRDECVTMPLASMIPTRSPQIWTSVATGCRPRDHRAIRFTSSRVVGLERPLQRFPRFSGAFVWLRLAKRLGVVRTIPISSLDVRRPPFWEILGNDTDRDIDVVGWWCSWPALPMNGRLVSDRFFFWRDTARQSGMVAGIANVTFPPELDMDLAELRRPPHVMPADTLMHFMNVPVDEAETILKDPNRTYRYRDIRSELPMAWAMDETYFAVGKEFLRTAGPNTVTAIYLRGVDIVSHPAMQFSNFYSEPSVTDADRERYGEVISRYYTYAFHLARRLIDAAGDDAIVLLISDHGFERIRDDLYGHNAAPAGVMMARLPAEYAPERPAEAGIYDIMPTLLWLCGYPPADDMPGGPLTSLFRPIGGDEPPVVDSQIPTYGKRKADLPPGIDLAGEGDKEMIELLRNLGYIR